jgi:alkylation response protein AidB-like acyl-CoA dehydrogenase
MDFEYTPEQLQLRREVRDFATTEIAPHVLEWDEAQTFPMEVVKKLGKLGYLGAIFPEEYGGAGLGYVEYAIIIEELSRVDGSVGIIVAAHTSLCSNHIYKAGTEEQKQLYLPRLTTGEWIGCWSLTEPEAGSDAAGTRTTAVRSGEDWVVNGSKTFTTNAHYADVCVGMAVTDRRSDLHELPLTCNADARATERRLHRQPAYSGWRPRLDRRSFHRHGARRLRRCLEVFEAAQTVQSPDL